MTVLVDFIFKTPEVNIEDLKTLDFTRVEQGTNPEAKIQIIEFTDYTCSFCKQAHNEIIKTLATNSEDINYVLKHYPQNQQAFDASLAAECARDQNKFMEYSNDLFYTQVNHENIFNIATKLELNLTEFESCLKSNAKLAIIQKDMGEAAASGIRGTPTFFINGKKFEGMQTYQALQNIILNLK